jgi:hypothetical protein
VPVHRHIYIYRERERFTAVKRQPEMPEEHFKQTCHFLVYKKMKKKRKNRKQKEGKS